MDAKEIGMVFQGPPDSWVAMLHTLISLEKQLFLNNSGAKVSQEKAFLPATFFFFTAGSHCGSGGGGNARRKSGTHFFFRRGHLVGLFQQTTDALYSPSKRDLHHCQEDVDNLNGRSPEASERRP